mgnify:CR=1 FL=1
MKGDRWASPRLTAPQTDQDSKRPRPEPKPADLHHLDYPPAIRPPNGPELEEGDAARMAGGNSKSVSYTHLTLPTSYPV